LCTELVDLFAAPWKEVSEAGSGSAEVTRVVDPIFVRESRGSGQTMNILLWVLQVLAALLFAASGSMKVFLFDKVSKDVPSFGALPRQAWMALGIVELICTVGLIVPAALHWQPGLTVIAATVLAVESVVFIWVHVRYRELPPIIMSAVLGLIMAFIAYGRLVLEPIS
jgi:uncharacterized membrane protein YphA (DoxX/SURF4 family)